ncbi:beta-ketoacyl-ACP synthase III [Bacteroidota bacterium]
MQEVFITRTSSFLPNKAISNDEMEAYLGYVNHKTSKSRLIVLRNNGIKQRFYAINKDGIPTHTNSEMVALAIRNLFENNPEELMTIDLLSCGTSTPDQMMPSHAVMVHGWLPETNSIEVVSPSGVCCSGMHAFKYAYLALTIGDKTKAVCSGSERLSRILRSEMFDKEVEKLIELKKNPYVAFEKEFLRWMLSDGAGVFLLENKKNQDGISLKVNWIEACSYANKYEPCMYMAANKLADGTLKSYMDYSSEELISESILSIKQDVKMLSNYVVKLGFDTLSNILKEKEQSVDEIDYMLPHLSSHYFEDEIAEILKSNGTPIPKEKWYTNLRTKGNVGAGSIYLMLDDLFKSNKLVKGQKILLAVPESSRFSYVFCLLTAC